MVTGQAPTRGQRSFHLIKQKYADRSIQNALNEGRATQDDIDLIHEFIAEQKTTNGFNLGRANKLIYTLIVWRRFIGPFRENTLADLYRGVAAIKEGKSKKGKPYKQNTINDQIMFLRRFYLWMIENGYSTLPEKKIKKIKPPGIDTMTKVASDLLTPEEVFAMLDACTWTRDRALIMMLYEGGFRSGELATLRWVDVKFDQYGLVVNVNNKTGKPRYIRLVMSVEHLSRWKLDYPFKPEGDALVFITEHKTPIAHGGTTKQLRCIAARAGVKKHITPHIFRHSRITHMIKEGISESVIKLTMWGNVTTSMFSTYAHLTGTDIDEEILSSYKISTSADRKGKRLEPVQCPYCHTICGPGSDFCHKCGRSFSPDGEEDLDGMAKDIVNRPRLLKKVLERAIAAEEQEQQTAGLVVAKE